MKYTDVDDDGNATWHWEEEPSDDPIDRTFKSHPIANDFARLVDFHFGVIVWVILAALFITLWLELG